MQVICLPVNTSDIFVYLADLLCTKLKESSGVSATRSLDNWYKVKWFFSDIHLLNKFTSGHL